MFSTAKAIQRQLASLLAQDALYIGYGAVAQRSGACVSTPWTTDGEIAWAGSHCVAAFGVALCRNAYGHWRLCLAEVAAKFMYEV